jgi:hypothetical protein
LVISMLRPRLLIMMKKKRKDRRRKRGRLLLNHLTSLVDSIPRMSLELRNLERPLS